MADEQTSGEQPQVETVAASNPLPAMGDENAPEDWSPPQRNNQGFAIDGHGLPLNLRLRAAALAESGQEDPDGLVDQGTVDAERARLAEYESRFPTVTAGMKTADLEKVAKAEGVDLSSASNNSDRVAAILAARPARV